MKKITLDTLLQASGETEYQKQYEYIAALLQSGKLIQVNLSDGKLPEAEAFLWIMKDGDAMIAIGCERGQVTATENVSFAPGGAINWTPTITGLDDGFQLIMDEGA